MARNGLGTYSLPSGNPVVSGTTISSSTMNTTLNDIANALTQSISSDGQTPLTANLSAGGYKITGLGSPTGSGDALKYGLTLPQTGITGAAASGANADINSMTALTAPTVSTNPIRATDLQSQLVTAFTTSGTGTAYTLTPSPATVSNAANTRFNITLHTDPGNLPTLAVSGQPAQMLMYVDYSGTVCNITTVQARQGSRLDVVSDGSNWVVMNPMASVGNVSGASYYAANTTIPLSDVGKVLVIAAGGLTLTLPLLSSVAVGAQIFVIGNGGGPTIARQGTDYIYLPGSGDVASTTLGASDTAIFTKVNTTEWYLTGGTLFETLVLKLGFGVNQTWQNVTGSRVSGTVYTNTTGRPIVAMVGSSTNQQNIVRSWTVNGVTVGSETLNFSSSTDQVNTSWIIPVGATYSMTVTSGGIGYWNELR